MKLRAVLADDDAVSPVVGVILMVAITVILAAGVASFVLGLGERPEQTPRANFEYEYSQAGNQNLTITHDGGSNLDPERIDIRSESLFRPRPGNGTKSSFSGSAVNELSLVSTVDGSQWVSGEVKAGTAVTIVSDGGDELESATVRVVYVGESGDRSATLGEWEGPDA